MTNEQATTKLNNIMHDDHYAWHPSILTAFDMAVDALRGLPSAQPTHDNTSNALKSLDCIDRQAAIDALCKAGCGSGYCGISCEEYKAIENLPSTNPEQRWVPITEKLPEKKENVIVTVNDGAIYTDTDNWTGETFWAYGNNVIAWCELPEPWKEGEADG